MTWRDRFAELGIAIHPAADRFPEMSQEDLGALGNDIAENGLRHPIILYCDRTKRSRNDYPRHDELILLDGRNRLTAMEGAGIGLFDEENGRFAPDTMIDGWLNPVDIIWRDLGTGEVFDPVAYIISANIHRRHLQLTRDQKRDLVAELLKIKTEWSDRAIANMAKVSPSTVGTIRAALEEAGDVSKLDTRTDAAGRQQPATKPPKPLPKEASLPVSREPEPAHVEHLAGPDPQDFRAAAALLGLLRHVTRIVPTVDLATAARGLRAHERAEVRGSLDHIERWLVLVTAHVGPAQ